MSGRHIKPALSRINPAFSRLGPALSRLNPADLKAVGGVIAGAALAGAIAASTAVATPNTASDPASHRASQRTLADIAVLRTGERAPSRHEAHSRHAAHVRHKSRAAAHPDAAGESRATSSKASLGFSRSSKRRVAQVRRVSAQQVINLAKAQVGTSEDRSGETKFNKWYMDDSRAMRTIRRDGGSRAAYKDAAWCDMFVSWVGHRLGVSGTVGFDAWAVKHAEWFKDHGRWGHQPRPGAVTFFGWNGKKINDIEHVGFTIRDNHNGTIETVEGNTHNTVAVRNRKKSFVVGYGYPDYKK